MIRLSGFSDEIDEGIDRQMEVVHGLGMHYISLRNANGKNIGSYTVQEFRSEILAHMRPWDVHISSLGSLIGKIPIGDRDAYHEQLRMLESLCQICEAASCRYIRIFSFFIPVGELPELYIEQVIENLAGFVEIAQRHGVTLLHENEKNIYGNTAIRCKNVLDILDSPNLRGVFDPGGFVQCGEDVMSAWRILREDIVDFHIKDALYKTRQNVLCGTGDGKLEQLLRTAILKEHFDGLLTLEPHLVIFDSLNMQELNSADKIIEKNQAVDKVSGYKMQYEALQKILERMHPEAKTG
jgi:sugar phosphate isomerase/epimerase